MAERVPDYLYRTSSRFAEGVFRISDSNGVVNLGLLLRSLHA